jgi:hypothetical protein
MEDILVVDDDRLILEKVSNKQSQFNCFERGFYEES